MIPTALKNVCTSLKTHVLSTFVRNHCTRCTTQQMQNCNRSKMFQTSQTWSSLFSISSRTHNTRMLSFLQSPLIHTSAHRQAAVHLQRHILESKSKNVVQAKLRSFSTGPPNIKRLRFLTYATYLSGAIGFCFLTAIAFRYYKRFQKRARGIEELDVPQYGRRSRLFCRYRGYVIHTITINTVINDVPWFEVRPEDTWVISYPKSGTTWVQEIVYLISNDFDFEKARAVRVDDRFPYLENPIPGLKEIADTPSPRFIKSHLPFSLLPKQLEEKKPKVIYIARNPKDITVSLMAFIKLLSHFNFQGTMDDFAQLFVDGTALYGPWWKHVQEGWERKDEPNVLFVTYEDLHKDFRSTAKQIARFLEKPMTEGQLDALERHCSFSNMQRNDSVNYSWQKEQGLWREGEGQFMRKGKVGDWKNHLSPEKAAKLDEVAGKLEPLGLSFADS